MGGSGVPLFCGVAWVPARRMTVVDVEGVVVLDGALDHGLAELPGLLAQVGDTEALRVPVAVSRGPSPLGQLVSASGRPVFEVAARGPDRDDPVALARKLAAGRIRRVVSETALPPSVVLKAWAHQCAVWESTATAARLQDLLGEHYADLVDVFGDIPLSPGAAVAHRQVVDQLVEVDRVCELADRLGELAAEAYSGLLG
ncbi:hypothetical protein [Amycolatopsis sp. CA-230715]|uniref:hypothetical protein n=1 Tax=Amycolatopsis sp. CA-230715 TaxID=2745196 RepID=UPI001C031483|nr:hypothetical protein [Amycolatopsis sp. CA-230715]